MNELDPAYVTIGRVPEGGCFLFTATLVDKDGVTPIPGTDLLSLKLTLTDLATGIVLNSRDGAQPLLSDPSLGVTVDANGLLTWAASAADNPFVRVAPPPYEGEAEDHQAVFEWSWNSGVNSRKVFVKVEKYLKSFTVDGSGSVELADATYAEDGVTPLPDVLVWVTSDADGELRVAGPKLTDADGLFTFMLDPGSYYLWAMRPAYEFANPTLITVP